jgi:hypothetical protein
VGTLNQWIALYFSALFLKKCGECLLYVSIKGSDQVPMKNSGHGLGKHSPEVKMYICWGLQRCAGPYGLHIIASVLKKKECKKSL